MEKLYELMKPLIAFVVMAAAFAFGAIFITPRPAAEPPVGVSAQDCATACHHIGLEVRSWHSNDAEPGPTSLGDCVCGSGCQ